MEFWKLPQRTSALLCFLLLSETPRTKATRGGKGLFGLCVLIKVPGTGTMEECCFLMSPNATCPGVMLLTVGCTLLR